MIVGLVSSFADEELTYHAVQSALRGCDHVRVVEGPVGDARGRVPCAHLKHVSKLGRVSVEIQPEGWKDDAHKRTSMLNAAKDVFHHRKEQGPLWCVWVDSDELLMFAENLPAWASYAEQVTSIGGFYLRIVELDGSVAMGNNRFFDAWQIASFSIGASTAVLQSGMTVQLPNEKVCGAGGIPHGAFPMEQDEATGQIVMAPPESERVQRFLAKHRPPVAGEPHILHLAALRRRDREVERQHHQEGRAFEQLMEGNGG